MWFWQILLLVAFMAGIMGWTMTPFCSGILWLCDWMEGSKIDWGKDVAFTLAIPFVWIFAIIELVVLYGT